MGHANSRIPREDRAEVEAALGALNAILGPPDLHQLDVIVTFVAGQPHYTLEAGAALRVMDKVGELVGHQLPSPTSPSLPSVAPSVKAAMAFFGLELPAAPTGSLDVEDAGMDRP